MISPLVLLAFLFQLLSPTLAIAQTVKGSEPYVQDFVLTAYYSPLPNQCCYVKGNYEADKVLNGQGTNGADGTPVYPGMIAAPPSYPFGTRITLPGLGTFTVHDRGGAIQEWTDAHRIDVWAGSGEEGLARALAFGVQHVRGTVYPVGSAMPAESVSLERMPAPESKLKPYIVAQNGLIDIHPVFGQHGLSVRMLQERLKELGYFNHAITGLFGDVTKQSLVSFMADMGIDESSDSLTEKTGAYLDAAIQYKDSDSNVEFMGKLSGKSAIKQAQRTMRSLGYYRGRTDGEYSTVLFNAILSYQRDRKLVGNATSPGAGRIGPLTKKAIDRDVRNKRIAKAADEILVMNEIQRILTKKNALVNVTMEKGKNGAVVRALQTFLAEKGFFPEEKINGNYGDLTAKSVASYQVAVGLLKSEKEKGAGTVGPFTLSALRQDQVRLMYKLVRTSGWAVL